MEMTAKSVASVVLEATVLRAVPCSDHREYDLDCPDCLTGEQAQMLGIKQPVEDKRVLGFWKRRRNG